MEEECDRMEYANSMMYDQYPDKLQLKLMCSRICDNAGRRERFCTEGDGDGGKMEAQSLRDLVEVILYQELYRRRCDHRRRCRRFY